MADHKKGFLVVSDLHLGEGRDPDTGWINPREDFLFDDDFADFLEFHTSSEEWSGTDWTLIIAGDFVDFLQVIEIPPDLPELDGEENYGLKAGPLESAWKIRRIMDGHPQLFKALAEFSLNHRIVVISGNHDAEFIFPQVRDTVTQHLKELAETSFQSSCVPPSFLPWFYYDGRIYVEHGNQYDSANAFPTMLDPVIPNSESGAGNSGGQIFLTLGSIFVRYLFNRVETSSPFADNIKPETRFIGWFIRNHPIRALAYLFTDGIRMLKKIKESWKLSRLCIKRKGLHPESIDSTGSRNPPGEAGRSIPAMQDLIAGLEEIQARPLLSRAGPTVTGFMHILLGPGRVIFLMGAILLINLAAIILFLSPVWTLMLPAKISTDPFLLSIISWNRNSQIPLLILSGQAAACCIAWMIALKNRRKYSCSRVCRQKASEIDNLLRPEYIIMGHCHETDLLKFPSGCQYINTGTWTKIFSRESSATREEKEFIFTRITDSDDGLAMDLMKWEARGGTGRRANLIDG